MIYDILDLDSAELPDLYIETATGSQLHLIDNTQRGINEINIEDIIIALSKESRYAGHTCLRSAYTVAAHQMFVWSLGIKLIDPQEKDQDFMLGLLLHDAHEYALKDLPLPIKQAIQWLSFHSANSYNPVQPINKLPNPYKTLADSLQDRIYDRFEVSLDDKAHIDIKTMDILSLFIESFFFMPSRGKNWFTTNTFFERTLPIFSSYFPELDQELFDKALSGLGNHQRALQKVIKILDDFLEDLLFNPRKHTDLTSIGAASYYSRALKRYGIETECDDMSHLARLMTRQS